MGSIHRIGVTIAGLLTAAVVGGAFVVQGYASAQEATPAPATEQATPDPTASPTLEPEVVYVNPVPSPKVINVRITPRPTKKPPVVHVVVPAPTEHEDDFGGSDD